MRDLRGSKQMPICKGCGEPIKWIEMLSGAAMPVDSKPLTVVVIEKESGRGRAIKAFKEHWSACPMASHFKKRKEKAIHDKEKK
jgi:hypothetical protein